MRLWILLLTTLLFISCGSNSSSNEQKNLTIDELNTHKTNTIPNIIINGDHTVTLTQGSPYNDEGATASDKEDGDISNKIVKVGNVNTQVAKTYTITYTITDSDGNVANANRSVIVKKRVGTTPIISLNGSSSVTIEKGTLYQDEGAISTDDEDGNITDKITLIVKQDRSENSKYILTYHIIDSDGNEASVNRILIVKDTKETTNNFPTIKLNGDSLITISIGTTYNEQGASASDIEDGDISNKITISGDVNTQEAGTYKITYTVLDNNGNSASAERTIIVKNNQNSPFSAIHDILLNSKNSVVTDATYICVGDSTRVASQRDNSQLIFNTIDSKLKEYNVNSYLIAKGGHELAQFIDPGLNQDPTYLDVVAKIPGDGRNTIVDISLGINDLWRYTNPTRDDIPRIQADIKRDLQQAISLILSKKPATTILFTSPNPLRDWEPQGTMMYMSAYQDLSQEQNIPFVNFYEDIFKPLNDDDKLAMYRPLQNSNGERDKVHYSDEGLRKMANYILEKIIP